MVRRWRAVTGLAMVTAVLVLTLRLYCGNDWPSPHPPVDSQPTENLSKVSVPAPAPSLIMAEEPAKAPIVAPEPVVTSDTPIATKSLGRDLSESPASELVLDRPVPAVVSGEITSSLAELLTDTHPGLPPETVRTIAAIVGEALENGLPALNADQRDTLRASILASRPEIANLPFEKSPGAPGIQPGLSGPPGSELGSLLLGLCGA